MILPTELLYNFETRLTAYGFGMPSSQSFPEMMLNDAVERVAREARCVERDYVAQLDGYEREGTLTADSVTGTTITDTALSSSKDDYYNGWRVTNKTRGKRAWVTDYVASSNTLTVHPAIANQQSGDEYFIENLTNRIRLPRDFIEEWYVYWGENNAPLRKVNRKDIRDYENAWNVTGTPHSYYVFGNYLYLYPRPSQSELLYLGYVGVPHPVLIGELGSGALADDTLILPADYKSTYPTYRLVGAEVFMLSGGTEGESTTIRAFSSSSMKAEIYPTLSATPSAGDVFCTLIDVPDDFQHGLIHYMLAHTLQTRKGFEQSAKNEFAFWADFLQEIKDQMLRRRMATTPKLGGEAYNIYPGKRTFDTSNI